MEAQTPSTRIADLQDIDKIFNLWESQVRKKEKVALEMDVAERSYVSILAHQIVRQKEIIGSTLAEKAAKGHADVLKVKALYDEKKRLFDACRDKIEFLHKLYIRRRDQQQEERRLT